MVLGWHDKRHFFKEETSKCTKIHFKNNPRNPAIISIWYAFIIWMAQTADIFKMRLKTHLFKFRFSLIYLIGYFISSLIHSTIYFTLFPFIYSPIYSSIHLITFYFILSPIIIICYFFYLNVCSWLLASLSLKPFTSPNSSGALCLHAVCVFEEMSSCGLPGPWGTRWVLHIVRNESRSARVVSLTAESVVVDDGTSRCRLLPQIVFITWGPQCLAMSLYCHEMCCVCVCVCVRL